MNEAISPYLQGNFAPWREEGNFDALAVKGKIPEDLQGVLLRNGPNPQFDPVSDYHWFEGDGMLHAVRVSHGNASYDNRWIRSERFKAEASAQRPLFNVNGMGRHDESVMNVSMNTANTNIVRYNRTLLALNEGASPVSMQLSNLATVGDYTFNGQITRRLSAHPRYDHSRKELMTYSYIDDDGRLMYYRLNRMNKVINQTAIDWPYPAMLHDFVITENYVIFPIFPCTMSFERMMRGESIFMWEGDELPTVLIITDRNGAEVARIETDAAYAYHFANAYEQGDSIIIDAMLGRCSALFPDRYGKVPARGDANTRLARWTLNLKTKAMTQEYLDERFVEFPRFDERFNGFPYQHLYTGGREDSNGLFDRLVHYDLRKHSKVEHCFDNGDVPSEPVFVANGHKEGQGYVLSVVYRAREDRSDVVIFNAQHIDDEPLAVIKLPHRMPFGFHGNFIEV